MSMAHSSISTLYQSWTITTLASYSIEIRSLNSSQLVSFSINFIPNMMMEMNILDNFVYLNLTMIGAPSQLMHSFFT
jgi:hypothetical protein